MALKSRLILQATAAFAVWGGLLFLGAGTLDYWEGWVFLGIMFVPMLIFCVYYYRRDPAVLERRMRRHEKEKEQRWIMRLAMFACVAGYLVPGLDHRFGWTRRWAGAIPMWLEIAAQAVSLAGYLGTMWVIDVNRFASRTVQVDEGQKVVSGGPYEWIRHPMYFFALVMWMAAPIALGSYVALPFFALLIPILVARLLDEEKLLQRELPGYTEYCLKTKYHLIPYVW